MRTRVVDIVVVCALVFGIATFGTWAFGSWRQPADEPSPVSSCGATMDAGADTAAQRFGWGTPIAGSEFTDLDTLEQEGWLVFEGPGYQGKGRQSADQLELRDGLLVITGESSGVTGAVGYYGAVQQYGRWEARIRIPQGDGNYHPVALLWPSSERWPEDGEIDYFESSGTARTSTFSLHHGESTSPEVAEIAIDRDWHTYAVEWTPTSITAYLDGEEYATMTNTTHFPPGEMWHSFQLDWMGERGRVDTVMEIDWLRVYASC